MGDYLYIASSKEIINPKRKAYLDENKLILADLLDSIDSYVARYPEDSRFTKYIVDSLNYYQNTLSKPRRNRLEQFEVLKIVNFLQSSLGISKEIDMNGNEIVDYMYELTNLCVKAYKEEIDGAIRNRKFNMKLYNNIFTGNERSFYSWEIITDDVAIKRADKSLFLYGVTGIPKEIRSFFLFSNAVMGQSREISVEYDNKVYKAIIEMDNNRNPRSRMFFDSEFKKVIQHEYPQVYESFKLDIKNKDVELPKLELIRIQDETLVFEAKFIDVIQYETIQSDIELEVEQYYKVQKEGKAIQYYVKKYERNPKNRMKAIKIHGLTCFGCGFNFGEKYGELGKNFIEIHHIKPLSTLEEEVEIDPETDLVPLCANCHRMVHRKKDEVLSVEELKELIIVN